jgi:regulator of cell morphogenesis and NO signaling
MTGVIPFHALLIQPDAMTLPSHSLLETRLGDLVTADPRIAPILDRLGLDYCCQGHRTLRDATLEQHIAVSEVIDELCSLEVTAGEGSAATAWPDLAELIQHIVSTHHSYVRTQQPILQGWLEKLAARHGRRHPELLEILAVFESLSDGLLQHMAKEENILFPYIERLWASANGGGLPPANPFGTILNPVRVMESEHQEAGAHLARLRSLTGGYEPPADGCTTYRVCFSELARFESDLHQHVHLENHVLFPRALALEQAAG